MPSRLRYISNKLQLANSCALNYWCLCFCIVYLFGIFHYSIVPNFVQNAYFLNYTVNTSYQNQSKIEIITNTKKANIQWFRSINETENTQTKKAIQLPSQRSGIWMKLEFCNDDSALLIITSPKSECSHPGQDRGNIGDSEMGDILKISQQEFYRQQHLGSCQWKPLK